MKIMKMLTRNHQEMILGNNRKKTEKKEIVQNNSQNQEKNMNVTQKTPPRVAVEGDLIMMNTKNKGIAEKSQNIQRKEGMISYLKILKVEKKLKCRTKVGKCLQRKRKIVDQLKKEMK